MEERRSLKEWSEVLRPFARRGRLVDQFGLESWQEFVDRFGSFRMFPEVDPVEAKDKG
jgi:hypothetical protein